MTERSAPMALSSAEQEAISRLLRSCADERDPGGLEYAMNERAAELAADPTYAGDVSRVDSALDAEQAWLDRLQEAMSASAAPYRLLAERVERDGQVDLADEGTRRLLREAVEDAGWRLDGDTFESPPQEMRRLMESLAGTAPRSPGNPLLAASFPHHPTTRAVGAETLSRPVATPRGAAVELER